jgi:hypothetical protein
MGSGRQTHHHSSNAKATANLTYYIFEGVLAGSVNEMTVQISAVTGGGGGSTKHTPSDSMNNPYMYGLKTASIGHQHQHGGPIPLGTYKISPPAHHPHLGLSARLDPAKPLPNNRGGFFIHGRGPHGSDGCIVPTDASKFRGLMHELTLSQGGTLIVAETMDGSRFA